MALSKVKIPTVSPCSSILSQNSDEADPDIEGILAGTCKTKLQCPLCFDSISLPRYYCSKGHFICAKCFKRGAMVQMEKCGLCNGDIINIRTLQRRHPSRDFALKVYRGHIQKCKERIGYLKKSGGKDPLPKSITNPSPGLENQQQRKEKSPLKPLPVLSSADNQVLMPHHAPPTMSTSTGPPPPPNMRNYYYQSFPHYYYAPNQHQNYQNFHQQPNLNYFSQFSPWNNYNYNPNFNYMPPSFGFPPNYQHQPPQYWG